jgi:protein TonB
MGDDRNWCRRHHADWDHACFDASVDGVKGSTSLSPPTASASQQIRAGGKFEPASLVTRVPPEYPELARRANISGTVILRATVGKDGKISELEYVGGEPLLMMPALDAVKQWRYKPALLNCEAVEVSTTIAIFFNIAPADQGSAASQ